MSTPDAPRALRLPAELTIYQVGELHPQWLAWLQGLNLASDTAVEVDAQPVQEVDTAGLQLLVSLQRTLADRGAAMRLHAPSAALQSAAQALGLWDFFTPCAAEGPAA